MILVVDDERYYAELLCEKLAEILVQRNIIHDKNYCFEYSTRRKKGYIIMVREFNQAFHFIEANKDRIDFLILDIIISLPENISSLVSGGKHRAADGGVHLFRHLWENNLMKGLVRKTAVITHKTGFSMKTLKRPDMKQLDWELLRKRRLRKGERSLEDIATLIADMIGKGDISYYG